MPGFKDLLRRFLGESAEGKAESQEPVSASSADKTSEVSSNSKPLLEDRLTDLHASLERLVDGTFSSNDIRLLQQALASKQITIASRGGVGIGGDASGNIIITGDNTTFTLTAEAISKLGLEIPHQIPSAPLDFTGRDEELGKMIDHFNRGGALVGISGLGGTGKTVLAFKLAEKLRDRYPDGQIMVNLRGTAQNPQSSAEAIAYVIRAYNPEARLTENEPELSAVYQTILHNKRALLLLDDAAGDKQIGLLGPPETCGVIVTSRKNIAFPGLMPIDLDILKIDKAVELLLKIQRPGQRPIASPQEKEDWNKIARLCGYLPLALRAAGSFLANRFDIKLDQYVQDLSDERTRLESIGKEGVVMDVGASFKLSYDNLPAETKLVFRMLSVFPADFDAEAEKAVCQDEKHKQLSELACWNLVEYHNETGRYHLHDLVRAFASKCLDKEDGEEKRFEVSQRFAKYYRDLLSKANDLYKQGGENVLVGLRLFDQEWVNIQTGQKWAENVLKVVNIDIDKKSALYLASSYPEAGDYVIDLRLHPDERIHWIKTALEAARLLNDRSAEGTHLSNLGIAYFDLSDYKKAIELQEKSLAISKEIGNRSLEGQALANLGRLYQDLGYYRKAIEFHEKRLEISKSIGYRIGEGNALGNLGRAYYSLGDYRKAIDFHEKRREICRSKEGGYRKGEGHALGDLGCVYYSLGDYQKAIEFQEQSLAIAKEIGNRLGEGHALGDLGRVYYSLGDYQKAIEFQEQSLAIAKEIGNRLDEGHALGDLGCVYYSLGDYQKAIEFQEQSLSIAKEIGNRLDEGHALGDLGCVYYSLGDYQKAIEFQEQSLSIAKEIGNRLGEGHALFNMGLVFNEIGDREQAIGYAKSALSIYEQIESPNAEVVQQKLKEWQG